jgi:hypothetical protein
MVDVEPFMPKVGSRPTVWAEVASTRNRKKMEMDKDFIANGSVYHYYVILAPKG